MWSSDVVALRAQGLDIRTIQPILPWLCGLALHADADRPGDEEQAYAYLDAMLNPVGGKALIEEHHYGHANAKSFELADAGVLKLYGLDDPMAVLSTGVFFDEVPPEKRDKLIGLWDQSHAGA